MGSTAGGTRIEIAGELFGSSPIVHIDGGRCGTSVDTVEDYMGQSLCDYELVNCSGLTAGDTFLRCVTAADSGSSTDTQVTCDYYGCDYGSGVDYSDGLASATCPSMAHHGCFPGADAVGIETSTVVVDTDYGYAVFESPLANYTYMNKWSSKSTWGGDDPPGPGDSVMIPAGTTVLFDMMYAELELLLVSGQLLFDDNADRNLTVGYLWLNQDTQATGSSARLQIGTYDQPFRHKCTITLLGTRSSNELALVGAKVIGGYSYTQHGIVVDIHGLPLRPAFTFLNKTANIGDKWLDLVEAVEWEVGDHLAIGPTDYNLDEREELIILEIGSDRTRVRVQVCTHRPTGGCLRWSNGGLLYKHVGDAFPAGGRHVDWYRAPVMRLTRNVLIQGDNQTVGQEFGAQIQFTATEDCNNFLIDDCVVMRLSNLELAKAGQGFFIGRYPIHFHRVGNVPLSFVRNNSVHDTFNRAITIHGVKSYTIEHNVVFESRGHSFFIEDGYETNNTIHHNLGIVVRAVWSQLKVDETPAMFWITNANNKVTDNIACGSTHYGYWFRMLHKPDGLSAEAGADICPIHTPMPEGYFENNIAICTGKYGARLDPFYPTVGGATCDISQYAVTRITNFRSAKNNLHGIYCMDSLATHFDNLQVIDPRKAGIEFDRVTGPVALTEVTNALFMDKSPHRYGYEEASMGAVVTYTSGMIWSNVKHYAGFGFVAVKDPFGDSPSTYGSLGWYKPAINGYMEHIVWDLDGSLTGYADCTATMPCYVLAYDPMHVLDAGCDNLWEHTYTEMGTDTHPGGREVTARVIETFREGYRPGGLRCRNMQMRQAFWGVIDGVEGNMRVTSIYPNNTANAGLSGVSAPMYDPMKICGEMTCSADDGIYLPGGYSQTFGGWNICINPGSTYNMALKVGESYDFLEESSTHQIKRSLNTQWRGMNMRHGDVIIGRFRFTTQYDDNAVPRVNLGGSGFFSGINFGRLGDVAPDATYTNNPYGWKQSVSEDSPLSCIADHHEYHTKYGRRLPGVPDPQFHLNTTSFGLPLPGGRQVAHFPYIQVGSASDANDQLRFGGSVGLTVEFWLLAHEAQSSAIIFQAGEEDATESLTIRLLDGKLMVKSGDRSISNCREQ
eukprot:gene518-912_t